jgi:hypothetical protein
VIDIIYGEKFMTKQNKLGLAAIAVVAVLGVGAYGLMRPVAAPKTGSVESAQTKGSASPAASASVAASAAQTVSYAGAEGKTALELLQANAKNVQVKGEGANAFVTGINGYTANDAKKEFWAFYVNGKTSDVGAGSYVTKAGDQIQWKIATY